MKPLGQMLRRWRAFEEIGVREAAARVGISAATFSRVERGHIPDADTLLTLLMWMLGRHERKVR